MSERPEDYPRWASVDTFNGPGGQINYLEPTEGKKDIGWNYDEKPSREYMNWWMRNVYQWTLHLDAKTDDVYAFYTQQV